MSDDAINSDDEAMAWLVDKWSEEVIGQIQAASPATQTLSGSHRRARGGRAPVQPANQVAFAAIDVMLTMVEGAAGVVRRQFAEILNVAVPARQPTDPLVPPAAAHAADDSVSEFPLRLAIQKGESRAKCAFVVQNTTGRRLHTVQFGLSYLTAGPGKTIPPSQASFEPARFGLGPHESRVVTLRIRTAHAEAGRYLGLAEAGRFRQVITLEVT